MQVKLGLLHLIRSHSEKNYIVLTFFFSFCYNKGAIVLHSRLAFDQRKIFPNVKKCFDPLHFIRLSGSNINIINGHQPKTQKPGTTTCHSFSYLILDPVLWIV